MPVYEYYCEENDLTVEVVHPMSVKLHTWGEVCYVSQISMGDTDPLAKVRLIFKTAPAVAVPTSNSELKNLGFTKLVKRDNGVYENVTAVGGEKRYMKSDDPDSVPHIHKKVGD